MKKINILKLRFLMIGISISSMVYALAELIIYYTFWDKLIVSVIFGLFILLIYYTAKDTTNTNKRNK